jgi:mycoredoxin
MTEQNDQIPVIMYGHPTCPMVPPVMGMLRTSKVPYDYINIHQDAQAAARVREINNGNASVPTLIFPDGSTLTEPTAGQLRKKLRQDGYAVPFMAMVWGTMMLWGPLLLFVVLVIIGQIT